MATIFPFHVRRDDREGVVKLQQLLEMLRDAFDAYTAKSARGTATIAATASTGIVSHNLNQPTYSAVLTPTVDPTGRWWISNKTSTQFQINLQVAAPVGGVTFDWIVRGA